MQQSSNVSPRHDKRRLKAWLTISYSVCSWHVGVVGGYDSRNHDLECQHSVWHGPKYK